MRIHAQLPPDDQPGFTQEAWDAAAARAGAIGSGHPRIGVSAGDGHRSPDTGTSRRGRHPAPDPATAPGEDAHRPARVAAARAPPRSKCRCHPGAGSSPGPSPPTGRPRGIPARPDRPREWRTRPGVPRCGPPCRLGCFTARTGRGSNPGHTWSWVGAAGMGDGTLGFSAVGRVWIEVLARRRGCPGATARTWPSRRWPVRRRSATWPPGTG